MSPRDKDTRTDLLRAAERLFAERGVDAVSLREIAQAAGQKNHSAALYHFGDKRSLLDALLARHSDPIQAGWLVVVEHMAAQGRDDLDELVGLMVRTLVHKLDDDDGGPEYLNVVAQLISSPHFPITEMEATNAPGIVALSGAMMRHIGEIEPNLYPLRMLGVTSLLYGTIASYQRLVRVGFDISHESLIADLTQSIGGLLRGAPRRAP